MRKQYELQGPYGVGMMMRVAHITENVPDLLAWYQRVFDGLPAMGYPEPDYLEPEDRFMTTVLISDLCIEIIAPAKPISTTHPVGKFYTKNGSRLHSVGYHVEDPAGLAKHLVDQGIRIAMPGGVPIDEMAPEDMYIFARPKDVAGIACELGNSMRIIEEGGDPRVQDDWTETRTRWADHPSTVEGLSHVTFAVSDLAVASDVLKSTFLAEITGSGRREDLGYAYTTGRFGDTVLEVALPDAGTPMADELERNGPRIYSITLKVGDLDKLEAHLQRNRIRTTRLSDHTVTANPDDCFNVPFTFTTTEGAGL